jgi:hypothetical protein
MIFTAGFILIFIAKRRTVLRVKSLPVNGLFVQLTGLCWQCGCVAFYLFSDFAVLF